MHLRARAVAAALAMTLIVVACGDDGTDTAQTGSPEPTTTAAAESTTTTAAKPTTTTAAPAAASGGIAPGTPAAAAADAYAVVFDSSTSLDDKKPHLAEADALADTIAAYAGAGQRMGGIKLTPTAVRVDGTTAAVTYDVYFGAAKQYGDLTGSIEQSGGTWVVSRAEFCGFMQSARTPCPA